VAGPGRDPIQTVTDQRIRVFPRGRASFLAAFSEYLVTRAHGKGYGHTRSQSDGENGKPGLPGRPAQPRSLVPQSKGGA